MKNTIEHYMTKSPVTIQSGTALDKVIEILGKASVTGAPVINERDQLVGFISARDCVKQLLQTSYHCSTTPVVNDVMTAEVLTAAPEDTMLVLAERMQDRSPKVYPVVQDNRLIGAIDMGVVLEFLAHEKNLCGAWS